MPWGETIADAVRAERESKRKTRTDVWSKLMDVANTGKGIWETLNTNKQAEKSQGWAQSNLALKANLENEGKRLQYQLDLAKQNGDDMEARNVADQLAENQRKLQVLQNQGALDVANARLSTASEDEKAKLWGQIDTYILGSGGGGLVQLRPDLYIRDEQGLPTSLDFTKKDEIKKQVLARFSYEDKTYKAWVGEYLDSILSTGVSGVVAPKQGSAEAKAVELGKYKTEQLAKHDVPASLAKVKQLLGSVTKLPIFGKQVPIDLGEMLGGGKAGDIELELAMTANKLSPTSPEAKAIADELAKKGIPPWQRLQIMADTLDRIWKATNPEPARPLAPRGGASIRGIND